MKKYLLLTIMVCCFGSTLAQHKKVVRNTNKESTAEELYFKAYDYLQGENGLPIDTVKAKELFVKSAEMGYAPAQYETYVIYFSEEKHTIALEWLMKAADNGYLQAYTRLFRIYQRGYGVNKDLVQANKWLRKGAESGDAECQWLLGYEYYNGVNGLGIKEDGSQAKFWLEKAVAQNHDAAMVILADIFSEGVIVKRDKQKANDLYRRAAEMNNYPEAAYKLATAYGFGDGVEMDKEAAFKWMKKAAELGYSTAQLDLGYFFATGYGCKKDENAAGYWWRQVLKNKDATEDERVGAQKNIELLDE